MAPKTNLTGKTAVIYRGWFLAVILVPFLALQSISVTYYIHQQRLLTAYLSSVAGSSLPPSEQVKAVVQSLKDKNGEATNSYFLLPVFRFLRPTPLQVVTNGGDCGDRSRLVIELLRLRGINASKWALYNAHGESKHAVVEVDIESGKMVADPLFGLWFPKPRGGYYDIREMKADPRILPRRVSDLLAQGSKPGAARLDFYEFNDYIYDNARTINWRKSALMKMCYTVLHGVLGDKVNQLHRPAFVEEPPLMVIYGTGIVELSLIFAWLLLRHLNNKKTSATLAETAQLRAQNQVSHSSSSTD